MWAPIDLATGEMKNAMNLSMYKGQGTLKRTKKKSYNWMKHFIETNGAVLEENGD